MVGGAVVVGFCLLVLGWTKEIVGVFVTEPSAVGRWEYWVGCETRTDGTFARGGMRL